MTFILDKLRPATVVRVHCANRVEFDLNLGLGVHIVKTFTLSGFNPKLVTDQNRQNAVHALVILLGGKDVLLDLDSDRADVRNARVYLNERIYGTPVGYVSNVPRLPRPILDVPVFMEWLAGYSFDVALVREVVQGARAPKTEVH